MTLGIIDPTAGSSRPAQDAARRATRPRALTGLRVGLLENTKRNAAAVLDAVGAVLEERHGAASLVRRTKQQFALPLSGELLDELARECDVVVVGVGDCGSCSAAAVADGIALERAGIPTAVICSDAFDGTSRAMAELKGDPGYPYLLTPHPVANLGSAEVVARGRGLVDDVVARLSA